MFHAKISLSASSEGTNPLTNLAHPSLNVGANNHLYYITHWEPEWWLQYKMDSSYLLGVKSSLGISWAVQLQMVYSGCFWDILGVFSRVKHVRRQWVVLELVLLRGEKHFKPHPQTGSWYLLGVKNISSHTHKTGSWYLLGVTNISSHTHKTESWYLLGVKNISSHTHKTRS